MVTNLPKQFCKLYNYPENGALQQIVYDTEDHNAWLEARKGTIGGSEVSVILGTNPYQSELHLWKTKQFDYEAPEPSVAMKKGTMMESVIFDNFVLPWCSERDWVVEKPATMFVRCTTPWLSANLDGLAVEKDFTKHIIEIKYVTEYMTDKWGDDTEDPMSIPPYYLSQIQNYMHVMDVQDCYLFAFFEKTWSYRLYHIQRDQAYIDRMLELTKRWYDTYLATGMPPKPAPVKDTEDFVKTDFDKTPKDIKTSDEFDDLLRTLKTFNISKRNIEDSINDLKDRIGVMYADGYRSGCDIDFIITRTETTRIDSARLRRDHPNIAKEYSTTSNSVRFNLK